MGTKCTVSAKVVAGLLLVFFLAVPACAGAPADAPADADSYPWWFWPLILFVVTFVMGILAVLAGVGGGVLIVPLISGFFPLHLDFVRGTGLLVALSGALAAGPGLLKANLASLRLAVPVALIASTCAIFGAMIGLALPTNIVQISLGATILGICALMLVARKSEFPDVPQADRLSTVLRIYGVYQEQSTGQTVDWKIHRTPLGLCLFVVIGLMAGMFGLGAGWANVPALNLVMGAPLKISVATSKFLLSITDTSAAWIYVNKGCVIPLMVVPSLVGIMLGSLVGVRILKIAKPAFIRWMVIGILAFAGAKALQKGIWQPSPRPGHAVEAGEMHVEPETAEQSTERSAE
ncbi:MAG: sulfite exporter TauE/SafE family protein [Planctomycetota bacterium]